jgi:hypothetical protein
VAEGKPFQEKVQPEADPPLAEMEPLPGSGLRTARSIQTPVKTSKGVTKCGQVNATLHSDAFSLHPGFTPYIGSATGVLAFYLEWNYE